MIPYVHVPDVAIAGPFGIHPFGVLVAVAVGLGIFLARRRARAKGVASDDLESAMTWILASGFVGAHLFDRFFYHPGELAASPWTLLEVWNGLSSFGGFLGAAAGGFAWRAARKRPLLPVADVISSIAPVAWIFGRAGCAVVHDHPGIAATAANPFAVAFPDGPRYDLGLLEMVFAIFLSIVFAMTWKRNLPVGTYVGAIAIAYAPVRFGLDFLRADDAQYAGLTPAQWVCIALFCGGVAMLSRVFGGTRRVAEAA